MWWLLGTWSILGIVVTFAIMIFVFCYDEFPKFRYYVKYAVYVATVSTVALIIIPFCAIKPRDVLNVRFGLPLVRPISTLLGIKWEVKGTEILARDFPCVIVCNHQSVLDFLGMVEVWPIMKKCASVAKKQILYIFPFGPSSWLCGTVFINRSKGAQSQTSLSMTAEAIQEQKTKMWIFPEGTRNKSGVLLPFKKGAFHIAQQYKLPVVPVIISPYIFVSDELKFFNSGKVLMTVLPPIETSHMESSDVNKLTEMTYELMNTEYQRLSEEVKLTPFSDVKNSKNINRTTTTTASITATESESVTTANKVPTGGSENTFGNVKKFL